MSNPRVLLFPLRSTADPHAVRPKRIYEADFEIFSVVRRYFFGVMGHFRDFGWP